MIVTQKENVCESYFLSGPCVMWWEKGKKRHSDTLSCIACSLNQIRQFLEVGIEKWETFSILFSLSLPIFFDSSSTLLFDVNSVWLLFLSNNCSLPFSLFILHILVNFFPSFTFRAERLNYPLFVSTVSLLFAFENLSYHKFDICSEREMEKSCHLSLSCCLWGQSSVADYEFCSVVLYCMETPTSASLFPLFLSIRILIWSGLILSSLSLFQVKLNWDCNMFLSRFSLDNGKILSLHKGTSSFLLYLLPSVLRLCLWVTHLWHDRNFRQVWLTLPLFSDWTYSR